MFRCHPNKTEIIPGAMLGISYCTELCWAAGLGVIQSLGDPGIV